MNAPEFDQMVFAGGGNRCWWQAGWWDVVQPELGLAPRVIAGISAGASTACMLHAWNSAELMDYYGEALRQNTREPAGRRQTHSLPQRTCPGWMWRVRPWARDGVRAIIDTFAYVCK